MLPFSVYLTALVRMFVATCLSLISSPYKRCGILGSTFTTSSRFLSSARFLIMLTRSLRIDATSYSTGTISIFPASILEKSRISLIMPSRELPALLMASAYSKILSSVLSLRIISSIPSTAFIGVLISWDILDKKALFASLAAWASSTASTSSPVTAFKKCESLSERGMKSL